MFNGVCRRVSLPALLVLTVSLTSCGTDSGGDNHSAPSDSAAVAAPAQQSSFGDFPAPAQTAPSRTGGNGGSTGTGTVGNDGSGAGGTDSSGPAHEVRVPGLGAEFSAQIPEETSQVLLASSPDAKSDSGTLSFFEFTDDKWQKLKSFDIHNGSNGWLADRKEGDKTTPIGVFTLSDAGGFKPDPGTKLPYTQDSHLPSSATTAYGQGYSSVFDYIIAIDYNRKPGVPPTDKTRPLGWDKGGGIWLHLDHDSGTHGCVTLSEKDLKWILGAIDPDAHPLIAMGPAAELAK